MRRLILIVLALCVIGGVSYGQGTVKREKKVKTEQPKSSEYIPKGSSIINGHEYVDLGLPSGLKWATCNLGATSPSDYGNYYAWGETRPKSMYGRSNCPTYGKSESDLRKSGFISSSGNLTMSHDAAHFKWGGSWRMPTKNEFEELKSECKWEWISQGGHNGYKVTGPNGRFLFFPAAGYRFDVSLNDEDGNGGYWSSSLSTGDYWSSGLYFFSRNVYVDSCDRVNGRPIRPVSE